MNSLASDNRTGKDGRARPFVGWASLGLSAAGLLSAFGVIATRPHENFVAAYLALLLSVLAAVLGLLAGVCGLCRGERPNYPAITGIVISALHTLLALLFLFCRSRGFPFESGF